MMLFNVSQLFHQSLPFFNLLSPAYLFGELFHHLIPHAVGILPKFRNLTIIFLPFGAYSSVDACIYSFHLIKKIDLY